MRRWIPGLVGLAALAFVSGAAAAPTFPTLTGRVVDDAGILPADAVASLDAKLKGIEDKTSDQFVVATVKSLEGTDIQDYGYQLGRAGGSARRARTTASSC